MSPAPPTPGWPIPSAVAVGIIDDQDEFVARTYVPVSFVQDGVNYSVNVELPSHTTDTAMALAYPSDLSVVSADADTNFSPVVYAADETIWRALTSMSEISGNLQVKMAEGIIELSYRFV